MLAVQPRAGDSADEELRPVGVWTSVGHGQNTGTSVLVDEVLVSELSSIDGLASDSRAVSEITSLKHELSNDSVEDGALEVKRLSRFSHSLLSGAQGSEVLGRLWDCISEKFHNDSSCWLVVHGDIEEDLGVWHDVKSVLY